MRLIVARLERLKQALSEVGISAAEMSLRAVLLHLDMVAEWNQRVNLTAITDPEGMIIKHAVDSATALGVLNLQAGVRLMDVGTGAGFPGVTLKCLVPGVDLVLLESLRKRCQFLEEVGNRLSAVIGDAGGSFQVVWGRAEEKGQVPGYREEFDAVVARAVAELRVLAEYCLPFCKVGGVFLAMKGPSVQDEVAAATAALEALGGALEGVQEISLPGDAGRRTLVCIRKVKNTPSKYPRKAGVPAKRPL